MFVGLFVFLVYRMAALTYLQYDCCFSPIFFNKYCWFIVVLLFIIMSVYMLFLFQLPSLKLTVRPLEKGLVKPPKKGHESSSNHWKFSRGYTHWLRFREGRYLHHFLVFFVGSRWGEYMCPRHLQIRQDSILQNRHGFFRGVRCLDRDGGPWWARRRLSLVGWVGWSFCFFFGGGTWWKNLAENFLGKSLGLSFLSCLELA